MTVDPDEFRDALSKFASGVTVVTVAAGNSFHGMTASSFASVSLSPPRVLVCLDKTSRTRALLSEPGCFAVNVLGSGQEAISRAFAASGLKPFDATPHRPGKNGAPLLEGAIAWIECNVSSIVDGGDHDIVVGDVTRCETAGGEPLIYHERRYRSLLDG